MIGSSRGQIWRYAPQYRRPRHFHAELELNLVTAGHGTVGVGEEVLTVVAGDLLSLPPGVDHELLRASEDFELYVLGTTADFSARVLGPHDARAYGGSMKLALPEPLVAHLRDRCAIPPGEGGGTVATETAIGDLWRDMQILRSTAADGTSSAMTRRTVASLQTTPEMGRDRLARLLRTHPSEVSRDFHRGVGLTLVTYRTRVRLVRFIHAVDRGASLMSAALEAGFGSYSQCHRAFRAVVGCTPSRFFEPEARHRMQESFVTKD